MHNLKEIRKDFDAFKKAIKKRSIDIDFDRFKNLDEKNRELIQKKEKFDLQPIQLENILTMYTKHINIRIHNLSLRLPHLYVLVKD